MKSINISGKISLIIILLFLSILSFSQTFTLQTGISLTGGDLGSGSWGDYDKDGNIDILITGGDSSSPTSKIYRNNGNNTFTEQSNILLTGVTWGSATAWGDYDNDGYLDILLAGRNSNSRPVTKIYHNNGDNSFTEKTNISLTGVYWCSVDWGDYNKDGYLDILLTGTDFNSKPVSKIYRNNGGISFTEQTSIQLTGIRQGSAKWGDYDNDGYLDILLTGNTSDSFSSPLVAKIYHNNGNNSFTEQTSISLTGVIYSSVTWGDYNNDGKLDILLSGASYYGGSNITTIYRNNGNHSFTEQTGISLMGVWNSSVSWGDFDNDGNLDIIVAGYSSTANAAPRTKIYHNNGDESFTELKSTTLPGISGGIVACGDYDNDGYLDILLTNKIYRNGLVSNIDNLHSDDMNYSIYPNSTSDVITINNNNKMKSQLYIYTINGILLYNKALKESSTNIDISNYKNGIYILKISNIKGFSTDRIVKF